jgi:DNA-nicking Smr family endonuclease
MGRKDRKHNNSEDSALFRNAVGEVRPVNTRDRIEHPAKPSTKAQQRRRDERIRNEEILQHPADDSLPTADEDTSFQRGSVTRKLMRELRGGKLAVREEIDLHGCTRQQAKPLLYDFIHDCARSGLGCVRVVHGKGMRSGTDGPVLKIAVNQWLRNWDSVEAFCPARNNDGGTGALYVLLKTDRR